MAATEAQDASGEPTTGNLQQRTSLDLQRFKADMASLARQSEQSCLQLFGTLRLDVNQSSAVCGALTASSEKFMKICLGDRYNESARRLVNAHLLRAYDLLRALISAFTTETILKTDLESQLDFAQHLEIPRTQGTFSMLLGMLSTVLGVANNARMEARTVISTSLDTTLSDGTSSINRNYINSICEKLLEILRPIVERILAVAIALNGDVEIEAMSNWELGFSASLKLFLSSALSLKMDLTNSGLAHSFIWPAHGEALDVKTMRPASSPGDNEIVALVVSPGLAYALGPTAGGMHQILVTAEVVNHIRLE